VVTETTLIGRTRELAEVQRVLARVDERVAQTLVVSGEPGIGKTRLLTELAAGAAERRHTVLTGRGTELERAVPFAALVEALDGFLRSLGPRRLDDLSGRLPHLAGVFPAMADRAEPDAGGAAERYLHHRAIRALLEELAAQRPLVLILDDVHWSDPASAEAIAHLLRRPPAAPVLLALAYRTAAEPAILTVALADAERERNVSHLSLRTLTSRQAADLLAAVPATERDRIFGESGGNPFYIEQLVRTTAAPPPTPPAARAGDAPLPTPAGVVASIAQELRHLSPDARLMLEGAAVAGEPFDPELAADAAGIAPERAFELLDEVIAQGFVRAEPVPRLFRFRHPIVRRAVYDSIGPGRRIAAHRRAADALRERGAAATTIAHHLALSARPGDDGAAAVLSQAAAKVASSAPVSAAHWLVVALSLLPAGDHDRRLALLIPLAQAQAATGALAEARESLIQITDELPSDAGLAWSQAVASLASVELALGRDSGVRRRLETALATLSSPSPVAVPLLVALAMDAAFQGEFARGEEACVKAVAAATGDPGLQSLAHSVLALLVQLQGAPRIAISESHVSRAAADFDRLSDEQLAAQLDLPWQLGLVEFHLERYEASAAHLQRGIAAAQASSNSQHLAQTRAFLAYDLFGLGRLVEAQAAAAEAVEAGRLLRVAAFASWALTVAAMTWSVSDARQALRYGEEALAMISEISDSMVRDTTHGHMGLVCAAAGEHERCIEHMRRAGAPDFTRFGESGRRAMWLEALVRSSLALGRRDEAREWAISGERVAAGLGLPVAEAAAARGRALVLLADGEAGAAAELAQAAADAAATRSARLEVARSQTVAARALAAAGDAAAAVQQLRIVRAEMDRCGARRLAQEAARELRALGATAPAPVPRRTGDAGTTQLSDREREIALLVAEGNSNPEIARVLYLSPKTVEGHMRRIFHKLGVTSRAQVAATVAGEQGERAGRF
jgi:ATP/maltotriose-dependent transcriptional regulator MalT